MEKANILQIIPAPPDMWAERKADGTYFNRVVCLALVEGWDGERDVIPMELSEIDGEIDLGGVRGGRDFCRFLHHAPERKETAHG